MNAVDGRLLPLGELAGSGSPCRSDWRGGTTARIARGRREHDGKTVIKEEQMPDGRVKLILKDEATGDFADVVVGV